MSAMMIVSQNRRKRPIVVLARKVIESGICLTYVIPRTRAMPIYIFKGCAYFFSKSKICSFAPPFIMGTGTGLFILLIVGLILWHLAFGGKEDFSDSKQSGGTWTSVH